LKFQLIAKVTDSDLLRKSMHELGTIFYQTDEKDNVASIVYFSGSRVVQYIGNADEELSRLVRAIGFRVSSIEIDEVQGFIKIVQ